MMRRLAILLLVCGGLGGFLQREQGRGTFDALERRLVDRLQRVSGPAGPAPPVVLVELRRGDLPYESWPPAPLDYALVFESLVRRQPRAVVVQPLLAWPGVEVLDAATLAERIALLPRGVLACTLQRQVDAPGAAEEAQGPLPLAVLPEAAGDVSRVPEFTTIGQLPAEEVRAGKAVGFTRIDFGEGMAVRGTAVAMPLVARRGRELSPSLALQALLAWFDAPPGDLVVQLGHRVVLGSVLDVPVDAGGRQLVSARLAPPLRRIDAGALLLDLEKDAALLTERGDELQTLRSMEGALVVLGETGESTPRFPVPGAPEGGWTEAEVVARSLVAALGGFHLREPAMRWQWIGCGVVAGLGAALIASPRRWLPVFAIGGTLALCLGMVLAFLLGRWWMPPVPVIGVWLAACVMAGLLPASSGAAQSPAGAPAALPANPAAEPECEPAASTANAMATASVISQSGAVEDADWSQELAEDEHEHDHDTGALAGGEAETGEGGSARAAVVAGGGEGGEERRTEKAAQGGEDEARPRPGGDGSSDAAAVNRSGREGGARGSRLRRGNKDPHRPQDTPPSAG